MTSNEIITGLTALIVAESRHLRAASSRPHKGADENDDFIATRKHNIKELRRIRQELEDLDFS